MRILLNWLFGTGRRNTRGRYSPAATASPTNRTTLRLVERDFDPDGNASDLLWHGFVVQDDRGMALTYDDPELRDAGIRIFKVAGVSYRLDSLQSEAFKPGNALTLVLERNNPHDQNAVSIWDEHQTQTIGYVPRGENERIRAMLGIHPNNGLMSLAESRKGGKRVGLKVIFGPFKKTSDTDEP